MIGLVLMANALATRREGGQPFLPNCGSYPLSRQLSQEFAWATATREYYAILDRITRGEKP